MFFPKAPDIIQWKMFFEKIQIEKSEFFGVNNLDQKFSKKKLQLTFGDQWSIGSIFKSL